LGLDRIPEFPEHVQSAARIEHGREQTKEPE